MKDIFLSLTLSNSNYIIILPLLFYPVFVNNVTDCFHSDYHRHHDHFHHHHYNYCRKNWTTFLTFKAFKVVIKSCIYVCKIQINFRSLKQVKMISNTSFGLLNLQLRCRIRKDKLDYWSRTSLKWKVIIWLAEDP